MLTDFDPLVWDFTRAWYHGSPLRLEILLEGSTITQDIELARVFSHKPGIVSIEDDPAVLDSRTPRLQHNGDKPGWLYQIDEPVLAEDVLPHPRTSMPLGLEWLTRRPLRLRLLGAVAVRPEEYLSPADIEMLRRKRAEG